MLEMMEMDFRHDMSYEKRGEGHLFADRSGISLVSASFFLAHGVEVSAS